MSFLTSIYTPGNIMDGVDIEDLTIEQYLELIQNHAPIVGIKVDDMTIAEYLEYEETIKTQDSDEYQPHSAKADGLGEWFEAELEKCWKIQQKRDNIHLNIRRQARDDALRNWEARIDQLRRQEHEVSEWKMIHTPKNDAPQKETSQIERISSLPKKPNLGSLTIPCSVDIFNINAIADLGASVNIMSESILEELCLADLKNANIIVEMADKTRCVSQGIIENVLEDPEKCGETKTRAIIGAMINKLPKEWFSGVSRDMDDLEGIIDYLEPTLYDGFIDHNDEAYKRRRNKLLGMSYTEHPLIIKEEAEITKYNLGAGEWPLERIQQLRGYYQGRLDSKSCGNLVESAAVTA
ncbi:hypothetical protein Tco_0284866 [Tanacetum coccineum]